MAKCDMIHGEEPVGERPAYQRLLITLVIMLSLGIVGYAVGKMAAGSFDFTAARLMLTIVAGIIVIMAARNVLKKGTKPKTFMIQILVGAVAGLVIVGGGLMLFRGPFEFLIKAGSWSQWAGAIVAGLYILFGLILLPMGFIRKIPNAEEMAPAELVHWHGICRWSALVSFAYGAAIFLLIAGSLQATMSPSWSIFAGVLIAMLVQSGGTWLLWQRYDELWRMATKDACVITFMVFEVVAFLWAGLTLAGFPIAFDPLGVIMVMSAIYLAANLFITFKRGMADV